jgi:hypothetical protein
MQLGSLALSAEPGSRSRRIIDIRLEATVRRFTRAGFVCHALTRWPLNQLCRLHPLDSPVTQAAIH